MQGSLPKAVLSAESKVSDFGRSLLRKFQKFHKVEKEEGQTEGQKKIGPNRLCMEDSHNFFFPFMRKSQI